ncbi:hypothetical protein [Paractinoplanes hotanensis]|uniref:Transposase n=1 Tax=Paractinoplanes hotanensis TaxID=2906497 RepID=A0ABT0Y308_9ACTN|nr:hypothetical protein [Actinoplanes hotanensis]MCM4080413.1 hypothetical protein [Actinoplanes hotanensis]
MAKVAQGRKALARITQLEQENAQLRQEIERLKAAPAVRKAVPPAKSTKN